MASIDLHWIPLGAGGPAVVRATGRLYAALTGAAPYHAALTCDVDGACWTIEVAPSPDDELARRGVVATGAVGAAFAARWRVFRYEVRCWAGGTIPDLADAVDSVRLSAVPDAARRVLAAVRAVPTPVWGLRWNSNSMVAWVLARAGLAHGLAPPAGGCAPGWRAGLGVRGTRTSARFGKLPSVHAERADRDQTTVVIADDHTVVRQGLRMLIDNEDGLQVIAEAGTVPDAERMTRAHRPSVLVLDLNMPGGSSLEAIPRLRQDAPDTAIVVLTMQDDPAFARQALQAGALGFVLKEAADEELLEAIKLAAAGDTYLNPRLGARLATAPAEPSGPPDDLSEREVEVLRLIALGHTNSEIAQQLFLSTRTVETHRAHIQQKLRRTTRAELVRYALEHKLVDL